MTETERFGWYTCPASGGITVREALRQIRVNRESDDAEAWEIRRKLIEARTK